MKLQTPFKRWTWAGLWTAVLTVCLATASYGQPKIMVDLSAIDGADLTPENILNYQVQSLGSASRSVIIKGTVHYRNSDLRFSYSFPYTLQPGMNAIAASRVQPQWQFSASALRELFFDYRKLPQGTYEYCVEVVGGQSAGEVSGQANPQDCIYRQSEDLFMITLTEPENNAKIHEYNPMLSWTVNYPFAADLTYRLRVAEIKKGQNTANAITRNNPLFDERNLQQLAQVYPVYAKPLKAEQPYAWTVDAYYRGILLGGAEPWKFMIVEDSLLIGQIPKDISYLDIRRERDRNMVFAVGKLKLKYTLMELLSDTLSLSLTDGDKEIKMKNKDLLAKQGDNRFEIDFMDSPRLKHLHIYSLVIKNKLSENFIVKFRFVNPDYL